MSGAGPGVSDEGWAGGGRKVSGTPSSNSARELSLIFGQPYHKNSQVDCSGNATSWHFNGHRMLANSIATADHGAETDYRLANGVGSVHQSTFLPPAAISRSVQNVTVPSFAHSLRRDVPPHYQQYYVEYEETKRLVRDIHQAYLCPPFNVGLPSTNRASPLDVAHTVSGAKDVDSLVNRAAPALMSDRQELLRTVCEGRGSNQRPGTPVAGHLGAGGAAAVTAESPVFGQQSVGESPRPWGREEGGNTAKDYSFAPTLPTKGSCFLGPPPSAVPMHVRRLLDNKLRELIEADVGRGLDDQLKKRMVPEMAFRDHLSAQFEKVNRFAKLRYHEVEQELRNLSRDIKDFIETDKRFAQGTSLSASAPSSPSLSPQDGAPFSLPDISANQYEAHSGHGMPEIPRMIHKEVSSPTDDCSIDSAQYQEAISNGEGHNTDCGSQTTTAVRPSPSIPQPSSSARRTSSAAPSSMSSSSPLSTSVTGSESRPLSPAEFEERRSLKLKDFEDTLSEQAAEVVHLDQFIRLNYRAFIRLAADFDRVMNTTIGPWISASVIKEDFCNIDIDRLLIFLSVCWDKYREAETRAFAEDPGATWVPPESFVRNTTKYWIRPDKVVELKASILRYVPCLIFGFDKNELENFVDPLLGLPTAMSAAKKQSAKTPKEGQLVSSIYFDSEDAYCFGNRLMRLEGAELVRFRWYGSNNGERDKEIFVERKTHHESWTGLDSTKERFPIKQRNALPYMLGLQSASKIVAAELRDSKKPVDAKKREYTNKLATEIQDLILIKRLTPMVRTSYLRAAFQHVKSNEVRFSIDTNLCMVDELVKRGHDDDGMKHPWCRVGEEILGKDEVVRFPYAVLEVKLQTQQPSWVSAILASCQAILVYKYSKFQHGMAFLHRPLVEHKGVPHWIPEFEKKGYVAGFSAPRSFDFGSPRLDANQRQQRRFSSSITGGAGGDYGLADHPYTITTPAITVDENASDSAAAAAPCTSLSFSQRATQLFESFFGTTDNRRTQVHPLTTSPPAATSPSVVQQHQLKTSPRSGPAIVTSVMGGSAMPAHEGDGTAIDDGAHRHSVREIGALSSSAGALPARAGSGVLSSSNYRSNDELRELHRVRRPTMSHFYPTAFPALPPTIDSYSSHYLPPNGRYHPESPASMAVNITGGSPWPPLTLPPLEESPPLDGPALTHQWLLNSCGGINPCHPQPELEESYIEGIYARSKNIRKVDPKAYFAAERTLLHYLQKALYLAALAIALLSVEGAQPIMRISGLIVAPVSILVILFSFKVYKARVAKLDKRKTKALEQDRIRLDDEQGPIVLVSVLLFCVITAAAVNILGGPPLQISKHIAHRASMCVASVLSMLTGVPMASLSTLGSEPRNFLSFWIA